MTPLTLSDNGWHHTGDIGRFDEDGYLWYVKRKAEKELIKPGGENVYPTEVEQVILTHEAVQEVSVIGVPDPKWGEAIKAVCRLEAGKMLPRRNSSNMWPQRSRAIKNPTRSSSWIGCLKQMKAKLIVTRSKKITEENTEDRR